MPKPLVRSLSVSLPSELVGHVDVVHPTTSFAEPDFRLTPIGRSTVKERAVPTSCNETITPACLQALYGIPTAPAKEKSSKLFVTGYVDQFAETADLSVRTSSPATVSER